MFKIGMGLSLKAQLLSGVNPFASLMSTLQSGAAQVIAHPLEYGSMFQDRAGTTPVTEPGQLVGMVLDHGFTGSKPVLGPELVTNGTFDTDSDWTKGTGWTISGGSAVATNVPAFIAINQIDIGVVEGKVYQVSFDVVVSSGSCRAYLGASGNDAVASDSISVTSSVSYICIGSEIDAMLVRAQGSGFTGTIDNISVRELPGYHATAISDAARGVYAVVPETGRRNLLTNTEQFDEWDIARATLTPDAAVSPDGNTTADALDATDALSSYVYQSVSLPAGVPHTFYAYFKQNTHSGEVVLRDFTDLSGVEVNLTTLSVSNVGTATNGSVEDVGNGWYRISCTLLPTSPTRNHNVGLIVGSADSGVYIWGAQLEAGSVATAYQKVVSEYEVTEAGVPSLPYLPYNGVNMAYSTPALPAPLVDKAQVFAGVRKLSDAAAGSLVELSTTTNNQGIISLFAPSTASNNKYGLFSRGSLLSQANEVSVAFAAPTTNVLTALGDISGDLLALRIDGTQAAQSTADQGTGNFNPSGTYPIYYGARVGTSLFFNGRSYATLGPITRFSATNATTAQIEAAEAYYTARVI